MRRLALLFLSLLSMLLLSDSITRQVLYQRALKIKEDVEESLSTEVRPYKSLPDDVSYIEIEDKDFHVIYLLEFEKRYLTTFENVSFQFTYSRKE